jgi:3-hydroxyisobutyrate dehydrogenase-like beta-hydroxyacid dehydrogenase
MKVGFIGLGTMGAKMASNLQRAGFSLVVNDVRREAGQPHVDAGANWAHGPSELGEQADVVFTSLPGPPEVKMVAQGLLDGMRPGTAYFDLSTNSPTLVRQLHAQFAERGIDMLDSPVSGGPDGARSGRLALWIGGDEAVFQRHKHVLEAIGDQVIYVGPIGAGSVTKLVHNCAGYGIQAVLAEVFSLGAKAGVDPLDLWKAVRQGAIGRRRTFDRLAEQFLGGTFENTNFALRLAHKDVTLATELGRELNVPMRMSNLALEELTEGLNRGWADRDSRIAMLLQEERSSVRIQVEAERLKAVLEQELGSAR